MSHEILNFLKYDGFILLYGVTLLFSIVRYRRYFDSVLKYFPIIIGYTFLTELLGYLIRENENFQIVYLEDYSVSNSIFYNIFDIILFLYFFYIFWYISTRSKHKILIKYGAIIFIVISILNPFIQDFIVFPQIYALTIGSFVLVACTIMYLQELHSKSKRIPNRKNLLFWISLGLMSFYSFYPALMIIGVYYRNYAQSIRPLHYGLIILMYLCFIIGFAMMRPLRSMKQYA